MIQSSTPVHGTNFRRVFGIPILLACISAAGLLSALLGDGVWDRLACGAACTATAPQLMNAKSFDESLLADGAVAYLSFCRPWLPLSWLDVLAMLTELFHLASGLLLGVRVARCLLKRCERPLIVFEVQADGPQVKPDPTVITQLRSTTQGVFARRKILCIIQQAPEYRPDFWHSRALLCQWLEQG